MTAGRTLIPNSFAGSSLASLLLPAAASKGRSGSLRPNWHKNRQSVGTSNRTGVFAFPLVLVSPVNSVRYCFRFHRRHHLVVAGQQGPALLRRLIAGRRSLDGYIEDAALKGRLYARRKRKEGGRKSCPYTQRRREKKRAGEKEKDLTQRTQREAHRGHGGAEA